MSFDQRLVLVRHGRTAWNAEGRFQGQADPPLDEVGWDQARRAARAIAGFRPEAIISSDLQRAHQTAVMVGVSCGLVPSTDAGLREVALGDWEGLRRPEAAHRYPAEYNAWVDGADVRRGGGETQAEAGARVAATLLGYLWAGSAASPGSRSTARTVVVVSHGLALQGAMRVLSASGLVALDDCASGDGSAPHLGNGEWIEFELSPAARTGRGHAA